MKAGDGLFDHQTGWFSTEAFSGSRMMGTVVDLRQANVAKCQLPFQVKVQIIGIRLLIETLSDTALVTDDDQQETGIGKSRQCFQNPGINLKILQQPGIIAPFTVEHTVAIEKYGFALFRSHF